MTGRTRFLAYSLLAGVGLAFASVPVLAAPILSDDLAVYAPGGILEADEPIFEPGDCGTNCVVFVDALGDPTKLGHATVLTDPDGSVSDIFGVVDASNITVVVNTYGCSPTVPGSCDFLAYSSDPGINAARFGDGTLFTTLPEGTGVFDATAYLNPGLLANLKFAYPGNVTD
jgi:hypothetical protein